LSRDVIRPEVSELKEARRIIEESLKLSRENLSKAEAINFSLEWVDDEFIIQKMGGSSGRTISYNSIIASFNTGPDDWKDNLASTVVHEFAHAWLYEKKGNLSWQDYSEMWEFFLQDAHAMNFVESVDPELPSPMREKFSKEEITELWPEIKKELDKELDWNSELMYGNDKFPKWTGYKAAYLIGKRLREKYDLNQFHKINKEEIIETGDKIFN